MCAGIPRERTGPAHAGVGPRGAASTRRSATYDLTDFSCCRGVVGILLRAEARQRASVEAQLSVAHSELYWHGSRTAAALLSERVARLLHRDGGGTSGTLVEPRAALEPPGRRRAALRSSRRRAQAKRRARADSRQSRCARADARAHLLPVRALPARRAGRLRRAAAADPRAVPRQGEEELQAVGRDAARHDARGAGDGPRGARHRGRERRPRAWGHCEECTEKMN